MESRATLLQGSRCASNEQAPCKGCSIPMSYRIIGLMQNLHQFGWFSLSNHFSYEDLTISTGADRCRISFINLGPLNDAFTICTIFVHLRQQKQDWVHTASCMYMNYKIYKCVDIYIYLNIDIRYAILVAWQIMTFF